jgi:hypothetical protein
MQTARRITTAKAGKSKQVNTFAADVKNLQSEFDGYKELKRLKADIDSQMKEKKVQISAFAEKYKSHFDESGRFELDGGYLRFATKSSIKAAKKFNLVEFVKELPEYLKASFNTGMIKKALETPEVKSKFDKHGVQLVEKEELEIVDK